MEISNTAPTEELMDFKKFAQSVKGLIYSDERIWIEGKFKEKGGGKIISGDNFWANKVHTSGKSINAKETYKIYLDWFNRNLRQSEKEREFVSAKFVKKQDGEKK